MDTVPEPYDLFPMSKKKGYGITDLWNHSRQKQVDANVLCIFFG